ncbi:MAG TPA: RseA family anti-sigma factor [Rhodocyclaceae bacterium]
MKTKLSGLMDGEIAEHEAQALFAALRQDEELRDRWLEYQLVGDTLKGERDLNVELTARVMAALDAEPTVLAPRAAAPRHDAWRRHTLALAATLAGVAVVGWLALGTNRTTEPSMVAQAPAPMMTVAKNEGAPVAAGSGAAVPVVQVRQASPDMREFLIAHEAQASLLEFRGGTEHIRTVAAIGVAPAK